VGINCGTRNGQLTYCFVYVLVALIRLYKIQITNFARTMSSAACNTNLKQFSTFVVHNIRYFTYTQVNYSISDVTVPIPGMSRLA